MKLQIINKLIIKAPNIVFICLMLLTACPSFDCPEVYVDERSIDNEVINFIAYGNDKFKLSRERIEKEANSTGWFSKVKVYKPKDIEEFIEDNKYIFSQVCLGWQGDWPRTVCLGGYGTWKPYIIKKELELMKKGEFLIYLDSGSTINFKAYNGLARYVNALKNSEEGVLAFQMNTPFFTEKFWTKADLSNYLKVLSNKEIMNSGQIMSTIVILKKNDKSVNLVNKWLDLAIVDNYHFIDDTPSIIENDPGFQEHRHDQSIFSLLTKIEGAIVFGDEIQYNCPKIYPFNASRIKK